MAGQMQFITLMLKLYIVYNGIAIVLGETYTLRVNSEQYVCNGGSEDTCIFYCDLHGATNLDLYCGNVGNCEFYVHNDMCGESSTIHGENASNIYILPSKVDPWDSTLWSNGFNSAIINAGAITHMTMECTQNDYVNDWTGPCNNQTINADYAQEVTISGIWNSLLQEINIACSYDQDHVYKENCGDMMLNADNAKNVAFRCEMSKCVRLAINETNAQTVSITSVAGGNCKYMEINAAGAQYLEIIVDPGWWGEAHIYHTNIYCPVNSDYNGPEIAPCTVDLSSKQGWMKFENINIYTKYGVPWDLWITITDWTSWRNNMLYCNTSSTPHFPSNSSDCWHTHSPTADPTVSPTAPTYLPTAMPTLATENPSRSPTFIPTTYPTRHPTDPTIDPTSDPTIDPTIDPTTNPTFDPTFDPTVDPTYGP
eukprot:919669_1